MPRLVGESPVRADTTANWPSLALLLFASEGAACRDRSLPATRELRAARQGSRPGGPLLISAVTAVARQGRLLCRGLLHDQVIVRVSGREVCGGVPDGLVLDWADRPRRACRRRRW